ncbi:hypothetical protein [Bradyrhizobium sp.]|uniref:hypothetical protein n=1 Tax=Bradyrhizobium sp. TaxID=376 RepID=UPI003C3FF1DE
MPPSYRVIFTEMLLANSAAMAAFADVAARSAVLAGRGYQQAFSALARNAPGGNTKPSQPGGGSETPGASAPRPADFARAFAGLPRVSMMVFLSQYDNLRGRRRAVGD